MSYILTSDITDTQAKAFITANDSRVTTWIARVDGEIESIAQELNVVIASISIPLHAKIKEYALSYFCYLVFQDVFTTNNVENPEIEKYKLKLDWYENRCTKLRPTLTYEMYMYTSTSLQAVNRVGCGRIWRA